MRIERADLDEAIGQQILTGPQAAALWRFLQARQPVGAAAAGASPAPQRRFNGLNVAYYFGALLVIGAMGWLMNLGWESFGGRGIFLIATLYAFFFTLAGLRLLAQPQTRTPGGLLVTMAVCMTPLAVYGLERMTGLWPGADPGEYRGFLPWIRGGWFAMEAATVLAGLIALRKVRFPFLVAPIAFVLYYQRHRAAIELRIEGWVPLWVRDLLPPARLAAR